MRLSTMLRLYAGRSARSDDPGSVPSTRDPGRRPGAREQREIVMEIKRSGDETGRGPADWFTGAVYTYPIATPSGGSRLRAANVHFTPGARTAWHTHPHGQTIWVTEGIGLCQRRGGPIEVIRPGDRVFFEPGEEHWHGAAPTRLMTHVAMHQVDDGGSYVTWGDQVSDEDYARAPAT
jgi:quercetin dioxygenase-like cupin family protein